MVPTAPLQQPIARGPAFPAVSIAPRALRVRLLRSHMQKMVVARLAAARRDETCALSSPPRARPAARLRAHTRRHRAAAPGPSPRPSPRALPARPPRAPLPAPPAPLPAPLPERPSPRLPRAPSPRPSPSAPPRAPSPRPSPRALRPSAHSLLSSSSARRGTCSGDARPPAPLWAPPGRDCGRGWRGGGGAAPSRGAGAQQRPGPPALCGILAGSAGGLPPRLPSGSRPRPALPRGCARGTPGGAAAESPPRPPARESGEPERQEEVTGRGGADGGGEAGWGGTRAETGRAEKLI